MAVDATKQRNMQVFDQWARWWNRTEALNAQVYEAVRVRLGDSHRHVLDVGCGTGLLGRMLVDAHPTRTVVGIDLSTVMLAKARELAAAAPDRLAFQVGDAELLPFSDTSFDAVVNTLSFHHFPHPERAAREFYRAVRPGGVVVIVDVLFSRWVAGLYNWLNPLWSSWSGREWVKTYDGMTGLLEGAGFRVMETAPVRYPLPARVLVAQRPAGD